MNLIGAVAVESVHDLRLFEICSCSGSPHWDDKLFFFEETRSFERHAGRTATDSLAVFLLQGVERWWDGESNVRRRVLLDAGRAKAHKAGYYVCKSRRVPQPQGKQAALRAQSWTPPLDRVTTWSPENTILISVGSQHGPELTANLNSLPVRSRLIG